MTHLVGCHLPPLGAALHPPPPRFFLVSAKSNPIFRWPSDKEGSDFLSFLDM